MSAAPVLGTADETELLQCTICLGDDGDVVQKGCYCRGAAGATHLECIIELASHAADTRDDWTSWTDCQVCKSQYTGQVQIVLAQAWHARVKERLAHKTLGEDDNDELSYASSCLANALYSEAKYAEAAEMEAEILESDRRRYGSDHQNTLTCQCNLAMTYKAQGKYHEAAELAKQALASRKRVLGDTHPQTLTSMASLADIYISQGRGLLSWWYVTKSHNGWITLLAGDHSAAEELQLEVLKIRKEVKGDEHPETLVCLSDVAYTRHRQGRYRVCRGVPCCLSTERSWLRIVIKVR